MKTLPGSSSVVLELVFAGWLGRVGLIELGMDGRAELYAPALRLFLLPGTEGRPQSRKIVVLLSDVLLPDSVNQSQQGLLFLPVFCFASPACALCCSLC